MKEIFDLIEDNDIDGVKNLIKNKSDLNQKDAFGQTPLHIAVNHENLGIIELLIVEGADVNATNNKGESPIFMVGSCDIRIIKLFLEYGADPNIKNNVGRTTLDEAYEENVTDIIELLQSHGAQSTIKPSDFDLADENYY